MGNQPGHPPGYFGEHSPLARYGEWAVGPGPLTLGRVRDLTAQFQRAQGSVLAPKEVDRLLGMMRQQLSGLPVGIELDIPPGTRLTVVGDIHGQLYDLLRIFSFNGEPSESNRYLFDGDFVDRGKYGAEALYPEWVHLLRGNHEVCTINEYYGFDEELRIKYPSEPNLRLRFNTCFSLLPVWAIVHKKIFVVHGGLPKDAGRLTVPALRQLSKMLEPVQDSCFQDLLWSDPQVV